MTPLVLVFICASLLLAYLSITAHPATDWTLLLIALATACMASLLAFSS